MYYATVPMTLNAALTRRATLNRNIEQLTSWAVSAASYQDGSAPAETADELLSKIDQAISERASLASRINLTNAATRTAGGLTLTEAIAARDALRARHKVTASIADQAAGVGRGGYHSYRSSRTELATVAGADVAGLRVRLDQLAENIRLLDTEIQAAGHAADLAG